MPIVFRITKTRYPVFDGTGAYLAGGRWDSPGHSVIYSPTCLAGSLLEVLVHAGRRQQLPGPHHCARAVIRMSFLSRCSRRPGFHNGTQKTRPLRGLMATSG